jgi:hypothetical protein
MIGRNNLFRGYLLLVILHLFHSLEEQIWGANFIGRFYSSYQIYFSLEIIVLLVAIVIVYFIFKRKIWALKLGLVYSIIMVIDGIFHMVELITLGKYVGGGAGSITGAILILLGIYLARKTYDVIKS